MATPSVDEALPELARLCFGGFAHGQILQYLIIAVGVDPVNGLCVNGAYVQSSNPRSV